MPKYKYYYDQETLSYRRIEVNTGIAFSQRFCFLTVSALFGLIMLLVLLSSPLIETPKEIAQAREIDNYRCNMASIERCNRLKVYWTIYKIETIKSIE